MTSTPWSPDPETLLTIVNSWNSFMNDMVAADVEGGGVAEGGVEDSGSQLYGDNDTYVEDGMDVRAF